MTTYEILCLIGLIVTHIGAYCIGKAENPAYKPTDTAWIAVQCHAIDKRFEHERWLKERADETAEAAPSGD